MITPAQEENETPSAQYDAMKEFGQGIRRLFRETLDGLMFFLSPRSGRERASAVFNNFFLHIHSTRIHLRSLQFSATLGLGIATFASFVILCVTGIFLMAYYKPSVLLAYLSIKDIHFIVPLGRFMRNLHRWAAHVMVVLVFLHMMRVFFMAAYKQGRSRNWLIGLGLLVLTLGLSFTGYLLPWDQLAYWAITIGANIAQSPAEITDLLGVTGFFDPGGLQKRLLLGADSVGQEALLRFYVLHCIGLPLLILFAIGLHFWRIRKDGGLARPPDEVLIKSGLLTKSEESQEAKNAPATKTYGLMALVRGTSPSVRESADYTIPSWPWALIYHLTVFMAILALSSLLAYFFDAPLKEAANPLAPENPAKAPWYFLGIQELVSYSAFLGGIGIPAITLLGLGLIPYLDRDKEHPGLWPHGKAAGVILPSFLFSTILVIGMVAFTVKFGWLRSWFPGIPQIVVMLINPGTIITAAFMIWSLAVLKKTNSIRASAVALFVCFLAGFSILTYVGTFLRGPNWDFYWSQKQWPIH